MVGSVWMATDFEAVDFLEGDAVDDSSSGRRSVILPPPLAVDVSSTSSSASW